MKGINSFSTALHESCSKIDGCNEMFFKISLASAELVASFIIAAKADVLLYQR
jgi:hypothetical protein